MATERQVHRESIAQEDHRRYKSIFESIEEIYAELDLAGNVTFFNESLRRISGYPAEELMGMNYREYMPPEDIDRVYAFYRELYQTGIPGKLMDYEMIMKDGSRRAFEASVSLMRNESGEPAGFRILGRDITARKQAEKNEHLANEKLQESEKKYRTILENIEDGYFEIDLAGNMIFCNSAMCRIADLPAEKLIGLNYQVYASPETAEDMFRVFNEIFRTGSPKTLKNYEIIRMDNSRRNLELSASLIRDPHSNPAGFRGIARDITERKEAEQMYQIVADRSFAGVYVIQKGIFRYINPNAAAYAGYTPEELRGRETMTIVHPDDRAALKQRAIEMLKGVRKTPYEFRMVTKDGDIRWIIETITPIMFKGERASLGNLMDITNRKQVEEALQRSFEKLRKTLGATVHAMANTVEIRDPYTAGHQRRVTDLARTIATKMRLSGDQVDGIRMAGQIHDLGKISIPAEILSRPGKLSATEFNLIKTHAQSGYDILKNIDFPWPIARMVLEHHERMDGSGYPQKLQGDEILLESRIIAVADVVEAISSYRPYRPAHSIEVSLNEIRNHRGVLYDPAVVDTCLAVFEGGYSLPL